MKFRQFLLISSLFIVILLLNLAYVKRLSAQADVSNPASGTIPEGAVYLPLVANNYLPEPPPTYDAIPIEKNPIDRPAHIHGDLNLSLRGYVTTTAELELVNIDGPVDKDAPQLADMFIPARLPDFVDVYQVHNWDWGCGDDGCRGEPLIEPVVTLLKVATSMGEPITIPSRNAQIFGGGYKAMVLYAEATRITLVYTRDDTPAFGYVVHLEDFTVEPALVKLYQELNDAGRKQLPGVRNGERIGNASGDTIKIAVRDTGTFMDPRSRKDWWVRY